LEVTGRCRHTFCAKRRWISAPRSIGPGIRGPRSHKQGSNMHLRRGFMVLFDPRSNARLAYRPTDVPRRHRRHTIESGWRSCHSGDPYHAQTIKVMYAPCIPLSTCLPSLLARLARVPSLLLYLPPSGPELVLRQSDHLSLDTDLYFPPQTTEKPSSCAKSGTVALNAPSSRTLHSSTRAFKRNRPNLYPGTLGRFVNRNRRLKRQHCPRIASPLPRSMSFTRNGQSPL
jgi:hypothetical protein